MTRYEDRARAADVARRLLDIGAVTLRPERPFTWSSGLLSPIYCDNRLTLSYPEVRKAIADGFADLIRQRHPDAEVIAGIATGGIPHAAWTAERLDLPMIYIRDKAKGHGKQNRIEGVLRPGQKTVLIEDLVSTGGSSLKAASAVREAGGTVLSIVAIFSYELEAAERAFAEQQCEYVSLSGYSVLIDEAVKSGAVSEKDVERLEAWRLDPSGWGSTRER